MIVLSPRLPLLSHIPPPIPDERTGAAALGCGEGQGEDTHPQTAWQARQAPDPGWDRTSLPEGVRFAVLLPCTPSFQAHLLFSPGRFKCRLLRSAWN